ncbi:hypothetical protein FBU30_011065, partial [Linnemannia zychae]
FVGQVEIRRLYCKECKTYLHRDIMAGHNICNIVRGHLVNQQRPLYLQPVDDKGRYPWMRAYSQSSSASSSSQSSGSSSTRTSSSPTSRSSASGRKRKAPTNAEQDEAPRRKRAAKMA